MKSSTIKRSALSKETMGVIENLANDENSYENNFQDYSEDNTPGEYVREEGYSNIADSKAKEIDMLWQSFKTSQFNTNSPLMCYIAGILTGIIVTFIVMSLSGTFSHKNVKAPADLNSVHQESAVTLEQEVNNAENSATPISIETEENKTQSSYEENTAPARTVKYVIKDGDTVEAIIKKHYGSYSPERAEAIMKANNLKNLDRISIDQVLLIPMDK